MKLTNYLLLTAFCYLSVISISTAAVVSLSGSVAHATAPASVGFDAYESDSFISVFDEQQGVTLTSDLSVDYLSSNGAAGVIGMGAEVNSYFVHFDPLGTSGSGVDRVMLSGSVTFDERIIGIIWSGAPCIDFPCPATSEYLDSSDSVLGSFGTFYPTGEIGRGLELDSDPYYAGKGDIFTVSNGGYSLDLQLATLPAFSDQLRVVTAVVPVPPALLLFVSGLFGLGLYRKK